MADRDMGDIGRAIVALGTIGDDDDVMHALGL
ncbi:hypothetical protein SDC9_142528 [bioreactor metagenome]|uniref:Uncharacterized protein n=1 Tax=bioreactor metagenome TaxID=1076179 RepID=A0A645E0Q7_9ZZZZ